MRFRTTVLVVVMAIAVISLFLSFTAPTRAEEPIAEPSLVTILNTLGYTNIALSSTQTFSPGTYEVKLLAEYGSYHDTNTLSYYRTGTSTYFLIFSGSDGNYGYVIPPVTKTFTYSYTFGLSMYVAAENHRYFTQTSRNGDGQQHAKVYQNLDSPGMYLIGFENQWGSGADKDYNDMVLSIGPCNRYLTVQTDPFGVTTISGQGWYSNGADVVLTAPTTVPVSTGVQYSFSYWDVDGASQGIGNNPITVHMDADHAATAHYLCRYYLTMSTNFGTVSPGNGWYDAGSVVSISATPPSTVSGEQYIWNGWTGTGSGSYSGTNNPASVTMNGPVDEVASWSHQYRLTMATNYGTTTPSVGEHWYDAGTVVEINATPPSTVAGERYVWTGWTGTGSSSYTGSNNPASVTMNAPVTETASWTHEYRLTISTNFGTTSPIAGEHWYEAGSTVEISATPPSVVSGERYVWNSWTGTGTGSYTGSNNLASITMNSPITQVASWTHEYRLTLSTNFGTTTPSVGEHWYAAGSTVDISATLPSSVSGERYVWNGWSGSGSGSYSGLNNPASVTMNAPITETASWSHEYRLTMSTNFGTTTPSVGEHWYAVGSTVETSATAPSTVTGERYVWSGWTGTGTGSYTGSNNPTIITMNGPITETASWTHQYYLTITHTSGGITNPLSGGWYDAGASVLVTAMPDPDYVLNRWELDGSPVGSTNPYDVLMNSAHTLHAVFEYSPPPPTNYYLTVKTDPIGITSISGQGWYDEGEDVTLTAPNYVDVSTGTRYRFSYWDVDSVSRGAGVNPITVNMDANHTATAHYTLQYYLTVTSPYDTPTPASGWFDGGTSVISSVTSPVSGSTGTRYVCTGWTGTGSVPASGTTTTTTFTMNAPSSITWNWKTQHYLKVKTDPSGIVTIPGEGWYDESTNAPLTAPSVYGYEFLYWDVDYVQKGNGVMSISVTMDAPHTATAHYRQEQPQNFGGTTVSLKSPLLHTWISLNAMLAVAIFATAFWIKKRQKKTS